MPAILFSRTLINLFVVVEFGDHHVTVLERHGVQTQVREMIRHFRQKWGPAKGNNRYLHEIFSRGGPQKQGNRLAGLLRTKGEH